MASPAQRDHWNQHALAWAHVGPPLRPTPSDVAGMRRLLPAPAPGSRPSTALLLGVTPELAGLGWPSGYRLLAIDRCRGMIASVWPGRAAGERTAVVNGDWLSLPVAEGTARVVIGDGCHTLLPTPAAYHALSAEVARVLPPGGRYLVRLFLRPNTPESPRSVFDDLRAGRIGSFHAFKWRLAMALHGRFEDGVRVGDVWEAWAAAALDPEDMARDLGWPVASIRTIDTYRGATARYTFPTLAEARGILGEHFREIQLLSHDYELAERCPTLALEPV